MSSRLDAKFSNPPVLKDPSDSLDCVIADLNSGKYGPIHVLFEVSASHFAGLPRLAGRFSLRNSTLQQAAWFWLSHLSCHDGMVSPFLKFGIWSRTSCNLRFISKYQIGIGSASYTSPLCCHPVGALSSSHTLFAQREMVGG